MIGLLESAPAIVTFLAVSSASFGLFMLFRRSNKTPACDWEDEHFAEEETTRISEPLASDLTSDPRMSDLRQELRFAGVYEPGAAAEYTTLRAVAALCVLACTALAVFLVEDGVVGQIFLAGVMLAALAYCLPRVALLAWRRRQTRALERDLPLAIDLLVLCLCAGQGLVAALRQTATQLRRPSQKLGRELAIVCQHAELHSLDHALKQWSDRVQSPEVRNLALLLTQSERLGTDTAATLHELAASYRVNSRQRAEAQANRTSFWMLFPSVFCFWVASAIILIGPAYVEFFRYRQSSVQLINQQRETLQSISAPNSSAAKGQESAVRN